MSSRRLIMAVMAVFVIVFIGVMTRVLLETTGSGATWRLDTPADLELAGRPQLVEFFHPL
jgi:hypothetical protein